MLTLPAIYHAQQAGISSLLISDEPPSIADKLHSAIRVAWHLRQATDRHLGVIVIFLDSGTPGGKTDKPGTLCLYRYIRDVLIALGENPETIAFVHDYPGKKRLQLEDAARSGKVRYLLGSTEKLGTGTNIQDRLIAVLHLDFPLRPRVITQRNGRIDRPGNRWTDVLIIHFGTIGSGYDSWARSTIAAKQRLAHQLKTSALESSTISDLGLTATELEAQSHLLVEDQQYLDYYQAKGDRQRLSDRLQSLRTQIHRKQQQLTAIPTEIDRLKTRLTPKRRLKIAQLKAQLADLPRSLEILRSQIPDLEAAEQSAIRHEQQCHQAISDRPVRDPIPFIPPDPAPYHGKPDPALVAAIAAAPAPQGYDTDGNLIDWIAIVQQSKWLGYNQANCEA